MDKSRSLGGLEVAPIGLGCMSFTGAFGTATFQQAKDTLNRAVELGVTLFDTANAYGAGENEKILAKVLGPVRDKIVISTKFGFVVEDGKPGIDGRPSRWRIVAMNHLSDWVLITSICISCIVLTRMCQSKKR